jgi:hypothetical protein
LTTPADNIVVATDVARALVGGDVELSRLTARGRNSRIWRVKSGTRLFALKQYPPQDDDPRDRLSTEAGALRLMERNHIGAVPRVIGIDSEHGYALLSWIDGSVVADVSDRDIDAAVAFLGAIHALREASGAAAQPLAAEACLSGREIVCQIEARLAQLHAAAAGQMELIDFLEHSFAPKFMRLIARAQSDMAAVKLDFAAELPQEWRTLVPSDFGFHNSLRRNDGSLAFLDFEYFGWDDPVKLTADIILHPGRALAAPQRERFHQSAVGLYGGDPSFARRLDAYLPMFGLRWVLILLNEFIPKRWNRRVLAGESGSWDDARARQLARAREFLAALLRQTED